MIQHNKRNKYLFACIAYLAMLAVCMVAQIIFNEVSFGTMAEEYTDLIWTLMSQIVAMAGVPLLIVLLGEKEQDKRTTFAELGFRNNVAWWVYPLSIVMGLLMIGVSMGLSVITQYILLMLGGRLPVPTYTLTNSVWMMLLAMFTTAVLPGFCEEVLHRGILRRGLKPYFGDTALILLTALMFSLMHTNVMQSLYTFAGGILMSTIVVKTRTIWPAMIMHFTNNAFSVYTDYASEFGWFGGSAYDAVIDFLTSNMLVGALIWLVCIAAAVALVYVVLRYGIKERDPEIVEPSEDPNPIYTGDYDPVTGRRIRYEYRFDPTTGRPLMIRRKPYRPTEKLGRDKLWLIIAIVAGVVYTVMSLIWRLL